MNCKDCEHFNKKVSATGEGVPPLHVCEVQIFLVGENGEQCEKFEVRESVSK